VLWRLPAASSGCKTGRSSHEQAGEPPLRSLLGLARRNVAAHPLCSTLTALAIALGQLDAPEAVLALLALLKDEKARMLRAFGDEERTIEEAVRTLLVRLDATKSPRPLRAAARTIWWILPAEDDVIYALFVQIVDRLTYLHVAALAPGPPQIRTS
jgi:hypothetical protein